MSKSYTIAVLGADLAAARAEIEWLTARAEKAEAEIERLKPMVIDWDGVRAIMDSDGVNWVHGDDYASAVKERDEARAQVAARLKAEAERDEATSTVELVNSNNLTLAAELAGWKQAARQMEAERDKAVAAAYEAAARRTESEDVEYPSGVIDMDGEELREILRALTPADAQAALEAYGREKVREGMKRAVDLYPQGIAAILAAMETLK